MANVQDHGAAGSATEGQSHGAEHTGFLHKLKEKLHIGQKHKEEKVAATEEAPASAATAGAPVVSKSTGDGHGSAIPAAKPGEDVVRPPPATKNVAPEEHLHHDGRPTTTDHSSLAGHESEHHGGVPTFLAALPDQDIPAEDAQAHPELHHGHHGGDAHVDSKQVFEQGKHHHDHHGGDAPHFDSKQVFEQAQQGEHHHGVPTFLVAIPDQDLPEKVTKGVEAVVSQDAHQTESAHHDAPHHELHSEELFQEAQQGEHHGGVPTFLVALPNEEIPDEVTKGTSQVTAPVHHELNHGHRGEQFDSEQVFQEAQQGEHHHGVPTFLVALPDEEIPAGVSKGVESTHDAPAANESTTEVK